MSEDVHEALMLADELEARAEAAEARVAELEELLRAITKQVPDRLYIEVDAARTALQDSDDE